MIEIGPNLKTVLLEMLNKLENNNAVDSSYIEVLDKLKELIQCTEGKKSGAEPIVGACCGSTAKIVECDNKKYPTESGYYWFKRCEHSRDRNNVIVFFDANSDSIQFIGDKTYYKFIFWFRMGSFIQPIQPIPAP